MLLPQPRRLPALRRRPAAHVRRRSRRSTRRGAWSTGRTGCRTWADLWTPDGNFQPQYDLAWRTFQAKLTTEFIAWQADIVREYASRRTSSSPPASPTTGPASTTSNLTKALDVTAGNPYYAMQDALAVPRTETRPQGWTTTGAWSLFQSGDRMYSSKQAPFLVTETNAGAIGGPAINFPAYDGQWRQAAWAFIARGARDDRVLALAHAATSAPRPTGSGSCRTTSSRDGSTPSSSELGSRAGPGRHGGGRPAPGRAGRPGLLLPVQVGPGLPVGRSPPPRPRSAAAGGMDERSYQRIFEAYYRGAFDAGVSARILHDDQLVSPSGGLDPATVAAELPVLVVAGAAGRRRRSC